LRHGWAGTDVLGTGRIEAVKRGGSTLDESVGDGGAAKQASSSKKLGVGLASIHRFTTLIRPLPS